MLKKKNIPDFPLLRCFLILVSLSLSSSSSIVHAEGVRASGPLVKKEERMPVVSTEYGEISAVRISDGINGSYLLHFFTLEPNSLLLPVILNADMIFYVHTGSGRLSWAKEDGLKNINLRRGDVYRLPRGTVFFIHCDCTGFQKLRIHAIFPNSNDDLREPDTGPYSSVKEMVLGFDKKVLQATFKVSEEVIEELLDGTKPLAIVHVDPSWEMEDQSPSGHLERTSYNILELNKKKKKSKEHATLFNLFEEDKDLENCNGWITTITKKKLSALNGSHIGLFVVNLNTGSMMGPHWDAMGTQVIVVLEGRGMVREVCSSISRVGVNKVRRLDVEEGDVFAVPSFHAVAEMSFNNGTFAFMAFSTMKQRHRPGLFAGQGSVLQMLGRNVLTLTFNVTNTTVDELLAPQDDDSIIMGCTSCAEEELRTVEEEEEGGQEGGGGEEEEEEERETEEEEQGGGGGQEEPYGTDLQHEKHDEDDDEWGRRIGEKKKRRTV